MREFDAFDGTEANADDLVLKIFSVSLSCMFYVHVEDNNANECNFPRFQMVAVVLCNP